MEATIETHNQQNLIRRQAKEMASFLRSAFIDKGQKIEEVYFLWSYYIVQFFNSVREDFTYQSMAVAVWQELVESCEEDPELMIWAKANFHDLFKMVNLTTLSYEKFLQSDEMKDLLNITFSEFLVGEASYEHVGNIIDSEVSKTAWSEYLGAYPRTRYQVANNLATVYFALHWNLPLMAKLCPRDIDLFLGKHIEEVYRRLFSPETNSVDLAEILAKYKGFAEVIAMYSEGLSHPR